MQKIKAQVDSNIFVETAGLQKRAFCREYDQRSKCIYIMTVPNRWHLLNTELDQGSCKFHLHEVSEQFPKAEKRGNVSMRICMLVLWGGILFSL